MWDWLSALGGSALDALSGIDYASTLSALASLGTAGMGIYSAMNPPPMPQFQPQPMQPIGYPQEALAMTAGNEATSPAIRQKKRVGRSKADLQGQLGGATISPALWELMGEQEGDVDLGSVGIGGF